MGDLDNLDSTIEVEESTLRKIAKGILKSIARVPIVGNLVQKSKLLDGQKALGDGSNTREVVGPVASNSTLFPFWKRVQMRAIKLVESVTTRNNASEKEDEQINFPDATWKRPTELENKNKTSEDREHADSSKPNVAQEMSAFDKWVKVDEDKKPIIPVGITGKPENKEKDIKGKEGNPKPKDDHDEI